MPTKYWEEHPDHIWLYNPSFPLAIVAAVLYFIPAVVQFYQTLIKYKSYYFIAVFIGALLEVVGYAVRAVSIKNPTDIPPYTLSAVFIIVAPIFVGAGDYLLISRLCLRVLPPHKTHIFRMPVAKLTRIFITLDILTFLIQCSGSGIAASNDWEGSTVKIGEGILIGGLALQLSCFSFFLLIVARFHYLATRKEGQHINAGYGWRKVLCAVYISSSMIIIRCIYRLIEFALGIFGYPFTHEWMFYTLECVPMLPAIIVFCVWHPGQYFGAGGWRGGKTRGGDGLGGLDVVQDVEMAREGRGGGRRHHRRSRSGRH